MSVGPRTAASVPEGSLLRRGAGYWTGGYLAMIRFDLINMRQLLPPFILIQVLMGAGLAVMYGFYFDRLPPETATFISSGAPTLAIIPIGMALIPSLIGQQKLDQTYDFVWSLPVPRAAVAASSFTLFTFLALPGTVLTLVVADLRYPIDLEISALVVPAFLLASLMGVSVGFGLAHAIPDPRVTNLIVNLIIFVVIMFSPIAFPIANFPDWLATLHRVLPFFHMANVVRDALTDGLASDAGRSYLVLAAWTLGAWLMAAWVVGRRR